MNLHFHTHALNMGTFMDYTDNLSHTILNAIEYGVYAMAFHLGNARTMKRKRVDFEDLIVSMGLSTRFPMSFFSFVPSMYNLCGNRRFLAWNGNAAQDTDTAKMLTELEYEMYTLAKLGGSMVIEAGSYRIPSLGTDAVVQSIANIRFRMGYRMVLVNSVDEFLNIGTTLTALHTIVHQCDRIARKHIGVGINVVAFYVNGIYDVSTPAGIARLFTDYDTLFSVPPSILILDDTDSTFGSKDAHLVAVGKGVLWTQDNDALLELLLQCHRRHIPVVTREEDSLERLRTIVENMFTI